MKQESEYKEMGKTMKHMVYISDEEREKCRKVKEAFAELEDEDIDIMVADAGRYGYVRLMYYNEIYGFDEAYCYTESLALFNDLWTDWLNAQLFKIVLEDEPLMDLDFEDIFKALPIEKQQALMRRRQEFAEQSGISVS